MASARMVIEIQVDCYHTHSISKKSKENKFNIKKIISELTYQIHHEETIIQTTTYNDLSLFFKLFASIWENQQKIHNKIPCQWKRSRKSLIKRWKKNSLEIRVRIFPFSNKESFAILLILCLEKRYIKFTNITKHYFIRMELLWSGLSIMDENE